MHKRALGQIAIVLAVLISSLALSPAFQHSHESLQGLATRALGSRGSAREAAVVKLRAHGPAALEVLVAMRDKIAGPPNRQQHEPARLDPRVAQFDELIDQVAGQRHACFSRLYWYTDFEQAKAVAAIEGKPILSLRMLGLLTDEYSCANSRFFRTTLYANNAIANKLREDFVLHWKSVRPVPHVTIDFGDGRKLQRTVTGNSIHYLLNANGEPLDALPGLYSPARFLAWLEQAADLSAELRALEPSERMSRLRQFHSDQEQATLVAWSADLTAIGSPSVTSAKTLDDDVWERLAQLPRHQVSLDQASIEVIKRENPSVRAAGRLASSKLKVENPLLRMAWNLHASIAADTVRNEYLLHLQIHYWFMAGETSTEVDPLNERVYAELFLTPNDDPWLGLAPANTYTGLDNGGMSDSSQASR